MLLRDSNDTGSPILPRDVFYADMSCLMVCHELSVHCHSQMWKTTVAIICTSHISLLYVAGYITGQNLIFLRLAAI